jgi:hypothetical protein
VDGRGGRGRRGSSPRRVRVGLTLAVAALCLSSLALATPSAASDRSTSAKTYAHAACTTMGKWTRQLTALGKTDISSASSLTELRAQFVSVLDQSLGATNTAITALRNAGYPRVSNGRKIAALIVKTMTTARSLFVQAKNDAQALPTDNPAAFQSGAQRISQQLNSAGSDLNSALQNAGKRYNVQAIDQAFKRDPACH